MSHAVLKMIDKIPKGSKRTIIKMWYEYVSRMDKKANMLFMNFGWADLDHEEKLSLREEDEPHRYSIQLYHNLVGDVKLDGLDVMEVGCGRGGGASYITRYLKPKSYLGVDLTANAVRFCSRHHIHPGLSFIRSSAESLQFNNHSFDVVLNLESSHCYKSMDKFLNGVHKTLKPDGRFLLADFRLEEEIPRLKTQIAESGLRILEEKRITPHVIRALELDHERKQRLIEQHVPKVLRNYFNQFAGMKGENSIYEKFRTGRMAYLRFVLGKSDS